MRVGSHHSLRVPGVFLLLRRAPVRGPEVERRVVAVSETRRSDRPARFRDAFAVGEFRALWTAYALSVAGDQLAAVGLSVLVFAKTGSPAWAAVTYAATFLPDL